MRRSAPLRRRSPLRTTKPLERKTRLRPLNPVRRQRRFLEHYHSSGWVEHIRSLPCLACGTSGYSVAAHVVSRGAGGTHTDLVPLCRSRVERGIEGCHERLHRVGITSFQLLTGLDLAAEARRIATTCPF